MFMRVLLCVSLWSCAALAIEPGAGYGVNIDWPPWIHYQQRFGPLESHFTVQGCDAFTLKVRTREASAGAGPQTDGPWKETDQPFTSDGKGGYKAQLNIPELVNAGYVCGYSELINDLQLAVTCTGDGRTSTSQTIPLSYSPGRVSSVEKFYSIDANRELVLGDNWITLYGTDDNGVAASIPMTYKERPFARHGDVGYLSVPCVEYNCKLGSVEDPDSHVQAIMGTSLLYTLDLTVTNTYDPYHPPQLITRVNEAPGRVIAMFADDDNSLVMMGDNGPHTVISRLRDGVVTIERLLLNEQMVYGDAMNLAAFGCGGRANEQSPFFMTESDDENIVVLRSFKAPSYAEPVFLPGSGHVDLVSLAPNGRQWLVLRKSGAYLASASAPPVLLQGMDEHAWWRINSVAWLNDTFVVSCGVRQPNMTLHFFSRSDGHEIRVLSWPEPDSGDMPHIYATPYNLLAETHDATLRLYNPEGLLVGGTQWPETCGLAEVASNYAGQIVVVNRKQRIVLDPPLQKQ